MEIVGALMFYIFRHDIHPWIKQMWTHLRRYTLYFLQYRTGQHTRSQIRAAQNELVQYAECAARYKFGKLVTLLLHRAIYHIPAQVEMMLPGAYMREDWGERCVRRTKRYITGHATKHSARASAQCCSDEMTLRANEALEGEAEALVVTSQHVSRTSEQDDPDNYGVQLHSIKFCDDESPEVCSLFPVGRIQGP